WGRRPPSTCSTPSPPPPGRTTAGRSPGSPPPPRPAPTPPPQPTGPPRRRPAPPPAPSARPRPAPPGPAPAGRRPAPGPGRGAGGEDQGGAVGEAGIRLAVGGEVQVAVALEPPRAGQALHGRLARLGAEDERGPPFGEEPGEGLDLAAGAGQPGV